MLCPQNGGRGEKSGEADGIGREMAGDRGSAGREGMLYLLLTGGEPFLYPDFWNLYEALNRMGFVISINTNGSMIDEAVVERLRERPPMKINLTLYGAKDSTMNRSAE